MIEKDGALYDALHKNLRLLEGNSDECTVYVGVDWNGERSMRATRLFRRWSLRARWTR